MADRPSEQPQTIRIEEDRIAAIGPESGLAASARRIDLAGATALPGLMDAHVHMTLDPAIASPADQLAVPEDEGWAAMEERALAMVRAGITTARDLGGGAWRELELRDRIGAGELPGPRLLCAGQPITSPAGHCHFWGGEAEGADAIRTVLARQIEHGVDWIKVMATGGMLTQGTDVRSAQFDIVELEGMVAGAREYGRRVARPLPRHARYSQRVRGRRRHDRALLVHRLRRSIRHRPGP